MSDLIVYQSEDGKLKIEAQIKNETIWLSQSQIAELFGKDRSVISKHIANIYEEGELEPERTCAKNAQVQTEGKREVTREIDRYNLDMILSVGYRVNSSVATRFRQWATQTLKEYIIKGFVMDDERMENSGHIRESGYFDELLERVRKIRTSEKMFYEKVKNIFSATSYDYDSKSSQAKEFYATVQNKFHFAVTGKTAAELVVDRIDGEKRNAGLTVFKGEYPRLDEAIIAKNYMDEDELRQLYLISEQFLSFAELQIHKKRMMYMNDWLANLDGMLTLNKLAVLTGKGSISHDEMEGRVKVEMQRYNRLMLEAQEAKRGT